MTLFNAVAPKFFDQQTREELSKKKIPELKQELRDAQLAISGNKPELIKRLLDNYYQEPCEHFAKNPHLPVAFTENWTERCQGTVSDQEWIPTAQMSASFLRTKIEEWEADDSDYNMSSMWLYLSQNPHLPSELIEEYWTEWHKGSLTANSALTPEIIENHWNEWDKDSLALNPSLTSEIIENHWTEWDLTVLVQNHAALTTEVVERHWDEFLPFIQYAPITYTYYFDQNTQMENRQPPYLPDKVYIWPNLPPTWITPELIEKGWGHWGDLDYLGKIPALTMALITKYEKEFDNPMYLAMNPNLSQNFIKQHHDAEDISDKFAKNPNPEILKFLLDTYDNYTSLDSATPRYLIARNPNLTEELMEKYWDNWDYDDIALNPSISPAIMKEKWNGPSRDDQPLGYYLDAALGSNPSLFPCGSGAGSAGFPLGIVNWRL